LPRGGLSEATPAKRRKGCNRRSPFVIPGLTRNPVRQSNFSGALRRRKRFWIPDQVRNDEILGCRRAWALVYARRNPRKFRMRRVRAGEMNRRTFVRPTKPDRRTPRPAMNSPTPGEILQSGQSPTVHLFGAKRRKNSPSLSLGKGWGGVCGGWIRGNASRAYGTVFFAADCGRTPGEAKEWP
jgi:hypothetical protein